MKRLLAATAAVFVCACSILHAASVRNVKISSTNPTPYIGEDFSLVVTIETSPGCEINNISISDMPTTNYLACGQLEILPVKSAGDGIFVHTVQTKARPLKAFNATLQPIISVNIVSRGGSGFFSTVFSEQRQFRPNAIRLSVSPLPEDGKPADFKETVGVFAISSSVSPEEVAVGDIVKFRVNVTGAGHIAPDAPILPEFDKSLFKTYSPKSEIAPDGSLTITQTIIPISTQAVDVASARLPFFDSSTHSYRVAESAPLKLCFHEKEKNDEPEIREVIVSTSPSDKEVSTILASGLFSRGREVAVANETELHIAPSETSKSTCVIPAGSTVYAVEEYGAWIRVRSATKCGWMKKQNNSAK